MESAIADGWDQTLLRIFRLWLRTTRNAVLRLRCRVAINHGINLIRELLSTWWRCTTPCHPAFELLRTVRGRERARHFLAGE